MESQAVNEIIRCLPRDRTLFYYFRDRYALMLLSLLGSTGTSRRTGEPLLLNELKQSRFGKLLQKPQMQQLTKQCGSGVMPLEWLEAVWPESTRQFVLTLDTWGDTEDDDMQTSRKFHYNLVLQLNFNNRHREQFVRMARPTDEVWINDVGHPVVERDQDRFFRDTLAWARIDLDFAHNEALIEEIQTDYIRDVKWIYRRIKHDGVNPQRFGVRAGSWELEEYLDRVLEAYVGIWDEAMLTAAIDFIVRELGITRIWYHSHATGNIVKDIEGSGPPKSLYTSLPKRFCFAPVCTPPRFLMADERFRRVHRKIGDPLWYRLNFENEAVMDSGKESVKDSGMAARSGVPGPGLQSGSAAIHCA